MMIQLLFIQCLALAAILGAGAYLFVGAKRNARSIETRYLRRDDILRAQLKELTEQLETLGQRMELLERRADSSAATMRTLTSGSRIQALRMIKHGEGSDTISGALGLPRTDVELLIKIQRMQANQSPQPAG